MTNTSIIIAGTTFTLVSPHKLEDIEKVSKYKPAALTLKDNDGEIYFAVMPSTSGGIDSEYISYAAVSPDGSKRACLTWFLPIGEDAKKAVADIYGPTIANANKVEAQIDEALNEINAMLEDIQSQITVACAEVFED